MAGSPRIIARPTTRSPAACRRARVRQGQAFGGAEEAPSLTAAAPRRRWKYAVGTEECSQRGSNKRMECKGRPDWRDAPLTKKAPAGIRSALCFRSGRQQAYRPVSRSEPAEREGKRKACRSGGSIGWHAGADADRGLVQWGRFQGRANINMVMAGCRPEYAPIVRAAML